MLNRRTAVLSLTGMAASMSAGLSGCSPNVPETLKIGVVMALSGPFGARGKDLLRGAELAVEQLNAAGYKIKGRAVRIEIVSVDDKGEPEGAAQGMQQVVDAGVHAVIGPLNTPQAPKAFPIVAKKGLPQLFTITAANAHTFGKGNTFRLLANDDLQARAAASFVSETLVGQRIVVISDSGDYGKGLNGAFMEALGKVNKKPVASYFLDAKAEVTAEIGNKIKSEKADVVVLFSREPHLKSLFKTLQDLAYTDLIVLGTNVVRNKNVAAAPIPVKSLYATATALDASEFLNGRNFLTDFEARYKEAPVWGAHYSYDAVYALAGAASSAETVEPAKLVEWLKLKELGTRVNHQMRFDGNGEQRYASIAIYQAERGAWQLQMRSSQW